MDSGTGMRGAYFRRWIDHLNKTYPLGNGNEWVSVYDYRLDKKGKVFNLQRDMDTYRGWKEKTIARGRARQTIPLADIIIVPVDNKLKVFPDAAPFRRPVPDTPGL